MTELSGIEQPRCVAHGDERCTRCAQNPGSCANPDGSGGCGVYAETGMHWDTCPNRIRTAPPELIQIPKADLQALFDLATGSMDFGSGFWDNEECDVARRVAVVLGVNPMAGTPSNFTRQYPHAFDAGTWGSKSICKWCSRGTSEPVHREAP